MSKLLSLQCKIYLETNEIIFYKYAANVTHLYLNIIQPTIFLGAAFAYARVRQHWKPGLNIQYVLSNPVIMGLSLVWGRELNEASVHLS